jgi:hypothetical protein
MDAEQRAKLIKKLMSIPPEQREANARKVERKLAEWEERAAIPAYVEQRADGTWIAVKLGCIGVGSCELAARLDLSDKVEMQFTEPKPTDELFRRIQEAQERAAKEVIDEWNRERGEAPPPE